MNILSLFDGCSCARVALDRANIKVTNYFASEIDKYAIQVSKKNYPDIIQLGDITKIQGKDLPKIDLIIGGSPCQNLSFSGNGEGLEGSQSYLFFEYVRLLKEYNPRYFLLENVASMSKNNKDKITKIMNVDPILINSALVSAQNRKRLYWTNIPNITQPEDKGIYLKDIIDFNNILKINKSYYFQNEEKIELNESFNGRPKERFKKFLESKNIETLFTPREIDVTEKKNITRANRYRLSHIKGIYSKSRSLSAHSDITNSGGTGIFINGVYRRLNPLECERLQTLPDHYTQGIINSKRFHMLGNGFTVDVIAHILRNINA